MNDRPADAAAAQPLPPPGHDQPLPAGDRNMNPPGLTLLELLGEDYRTHASSVFQPGLLAVAVHRFGNARMGVQNAVLRAPLTLLYRLLYTLVNWFWGIDLPYTTRLGRRVRIWHHGGIVLGARAIGDDVHIRHNTTFGVANRRDLTGKPILGNRVEVGVGACILGAVTVGDDSTVGPNSVVLKDVPPRTVVLGVPARPATLADARQAADGPPQSR